MWNASKTIDLTLDEESHSGSETIGTSSSSEEADESSEATMPAIKRSARRLEPDELDAHPDKKKRSSLTVGKQIIGSEMAAVASMRKLTNSNESCDEDSTDSDDSEPPPPQKRKRKKKRFRPMEEADSGLEIIETSSSGEDVEESWVARMPNNKRGCLAFQPGTLDAHPDNKKRSNVAVRKRRSVLEETAVDAIRKAVNSKKSYDDDSTSSDDDSEPPIQKQRKRKKKRFRPMEEAASGSEITETSSSGEEAEESWVARMPKNKRRSLAFQPGTLDAHTDNVAVRKRIGGSKTAPAVKRNFTSSKESCDDDSTSSDDVESPPPKKRKQKKKKPKHEPQKGEPQKDLQTYGDYVLQFQDDETGKPIHPSAMRYSIKLMEKEASRATESVAQSLLEDGEVAESRKVQARSSNHVEKIVSRVRRYLAVVKIPKDYVRGGDLIAVDLERTNARRQKEIGEKKKISKQLVRQRKLLQKEKNKAKARRDRLQTQLNDLKAQLSADDGSGSSIQMLLPNKADTGLSETASSEPRPLDRSTLTTVSKDAMNKLLSEVPSPYD